MIEKVGSAELWDFRWNDSHVSVGGDQHDPWSTGTDHSRAEVVVTLNSDMSEPAPENLTSLTSVCSGCAKTRLISTTCFVSSSGATPSGAKPERLRLGVPSLRNVGTDTEGTGGTALRLFVPSASMGCFISIKFQEGPFNLHFRFVMWELHNYRAV